MFIYLYFSYYDVIVIIFSYKWQLWSLQIQYKHIILYSNNKTFIKIIYLLQKRPSRRSHAEYHSPVHYFAMRHHRTMIEWLNIHCTDICNINVNELLLSAIEDGRRDVVECLLARGADVNYCNDNGDTPLHQAARPPPSARNVQVTLLYIYSHCVNLIAKFYIVQKSLNVFWIEYIFYKYWYITFFLDEKSCCNN